MIAEYKDRLATAMSRATVGTTQLAKALGVSYQAVKAVVDGKSSGFGIVNNSRAARILGVSSDWLATGEVEMLAVTSGVATLVVQTLESHLKAVSGYLKLLDDGARRRAGTLLADLAVSPDDYAEIAGMIQDSVNRANGAAAQHPTAKFISSGGR